MERYNPLQDDNRSAQEDFVDKWNDTVRVDDIYTSSPDGPDANAPAGHEFTSLDVIGKHCASVTGISDGKQHSFRLLARMGGFELYVDDLLVQMYIYNPSGGKIGLLARNAEAVFSDLRAWSMSL